MSRSYSEKFDLCAVVIEEVITAALPDAQDSWPNLKPLEHVGMGAQDWVQTAMSIISKLNEKIGADEISVPVLVILDFGNQVLSAFQHHLTSLVPS